MYHCHNAVAAVCLPSLCPHVSLFMPMVKGCCDVMVVSWGCVEVESSGLVLCAGPRASRQGVRDVSVSACLCECKACAGYTEVGSVVTGIATADLVVGGNEPTGSAGPGVVAAGPHITANCGTPPR